MSFGGEFSKKGARFKNSPPNANRKYTGPIHTPEHSTLYPSLQPSTPTYRILPSDDDAMRERARRQARSALQSQQDKTRAFDAQVRKTGAKSALNLEDCMFGVPSISVSVDAAFLNPSFLKPI
mgnify:CR=1 FL=1